MLETSIHLIQYGISFIVVTLIWPKLIFSGPRRSFLEGFFSGFIQISVLLIIIGYLMVLLQIFELISLVFILALLALSRIFTGKSKLNRRLLSKEFKLWAYDYIDGLINIPKLFVRKYKIGKKNIVDSYEVKHKFFIYNLLAGLVIFGYSFYLRIYDVFMNAAPGMSDAYVTLAWIKYINSNLLFQDGIYPQGFYIYQAVISKFSGLDPLFVLKITGPVNSMLIVLGLYFFASRLFKSKTKGLAAAFVYGVFSQFLTLSQERQVATNAQEFAFIFIFPTLYFLLMYINEGRKKDLFTAISGIVLIGLIHAFAFAFVALGVFSLLIVMLLSKVENKYYKLKTIVLGSIISGIIAVAPAAIGLLAGKSFHSASADFAFERNIATFVPNIAILDIIVFAGIFILVLYVLVTKKLTGIHPEIFVAVFAIFTLVLYFFGGVITSSIVIMARARELYPLVVPIVISGAVFFLFEFIKSKKIKGIINSVLMLIISVILIAYVKPAPIVPYKMEYNSFVLQYIKISTSYRPTEWLIISQEEGYALSYGKGWHLMTKEFLELNENHEQKNVLESANFDIFPPNIFIYIEKMPHPTYMSMIELEEINQRRINESQKLSLWVNEYLEVYDDISLFYEDDKLLVYEIYKADISKELSKKVLG